MRREEHCKQISLTCVESAHSVWTTLGLPQLTAAFTFWVYPAQAPGCSAGELSKAGPGLQVLPRSKLLRFRFLGIPQRRRPGWACVLCPSQVRAAQVTRWLGEHTLPRWAVHLITSPVPAAWCPGCAAGISGVLCVSSGELISGCDLPGRCQQSRIPVRFC